MKISRLYIDKFGHFEDFSIETFSEGLTLIEGPNEAGKSTLLAFIRDVLYGFEGSRRQYRYEIYPGATYGGRLVVEDPAGLQWVVERMRGTRAGGEARVFPLGEETGRHHERDAAELTGHTTRGIFSNIFAFGLSELQSLESLQAEEIRSRIYSAGVGTGPISPLDLEKKLHKQREEIYKPNGRNQPIAELIRQYNELNMKIQQVQQLPDEYHALTSQAEALQIRMEEAEAQWKQLGQQLDQTKLLAQIREYRDQLRSVDATLEVFPDLSSFRSTSKMQYERFSEDLLTLQKTQNELSAELAMLQMKLESAEGNSEILQEKTVLDELFSSIHSFDKDSRLQHELSAIIEEKERSVRDSLANLGTDWSVPRVLQVDTSWEVHRHVGAVEQELEQRLRASQAASLEVLQIDKELEHLTGTYQSLTKQISRLSNELLSVSDYQRIEGELLQVSRQCRTLRDTQLRLLEVNARMESLSQQEGWLETAVISKSGKSVNAIVFLCIGILLMGIGGLLSSERFLLLIGPIFLLSGGISLWLKPNTRGDAANQIKSIRLQRDDLMNQQQGLQTQTQQMQADMAEKLAHFIKVLPNSAGDLHRLREENEFEELVNQLVSICRSCLGKVTEADFIRSQLREVAVTLESLKESQAKAASVQSDADRFYQDCQAEWKAWLVANGLPLLRPIEIRDLLAMLAKVNTQISELQEKKREYTRVTERIHQFIGNLNQICHRIGLDRVEPDQVRFVVHKLKELLEAANHQEQLRQEWQVRLEELREKRKLFEQEYEEKLQHLTHFLVEHGVQTTEEFEHRAAKYEQFLAEHEQRRRLLLQAEAVAGSSQRLQSLFDECISEDQVTFERRALELEAERNRLSEQKDQLNQEYGQVKERLKRLESDDSHAELATQRTEVVANLQHYAEQWAIQTISAALLAKAREKYEKERQPSVLNQASTLMNKITSGRYLHVRTKLGEDRIHLVRADDRYLPLEALSRGTAEQLYLSMRIALIQELSSRNIVLPLVMDDIFVNFDPARVKSVLSLLREITETHQVLYLTCHPQIANLLASEIPQTKRVKLADKTAQENTSTSARYTTVS